MTSEDRFIPKTKGIPAAEREPQDLEVEVITRALELEALAVPVEEYGDPYANVKELIRVLSETGRTEDVVKLFERHVPFLREDVFGVPLDMFGDAERLYRFTIDQLVGCGHMRAAEKVFAHIEERGPELHRKLASSLGEQYTESDVEAYLNDCRFDLLCARVRYGQGSRAGNLEEEADLASDLVARMAESFPNHKASSYLRLAEAKHAAGLHPEEELNQAERLINLLPLEDMEKFYWVAQLVEVSMRVGSDSERRLQLLLQCGYRALHADDVQGEVFKNTVDALRALHGKKADPNMPMMSPQLAANISDPLTKVIRVVAQKGNRELAFQLAETELFEDWTRWEAYESAISELPEEEKVPSEVFARLRELCRDVSLSAERDRFERLIIGLAKRDNVSEALELIDLTSFEPKDKRRVYMALAEAITHSGGDSTVVATHLPLPRTVEEWASLGMFDEAERTFDGFGVRGRIKTGIALIEDCARSNRDIKTLLNKVYRAFQSDKPTGDFDSEYDWLHKYGTQDLFILLMRLKNPGKEK